MAASARLRFRLNALEEKAKPLRFVTWNVKDVFFAKDVTDRKAAFKRAGGALKPDILVIQEVVSRKTVVAVRDAMGLSGYHVACSDFVPDKEVDLNGQWKRVAFEVAIIGRLPLSDVIEYDCTPDNTAGPKERPLVPPIGVVLWRKRPSRGVLWARIDSVGLTVIVLHLKSSVGKTGRDDFRNSSSREWVAAAAAGRVSKDRRLFPKHTCVVAGDFNVAHADQVKNGKNLDIDDPDGRTGRDGYDETHAMFRAGLVAGLRMTSLAVGIRRSSYPDYPQNFPIDNVYIVGPSAAKFSKAKLAANTFTSDHLALTTIAKDLKPVKAAKPAEGPAPATVYVTPTGACYHLISCQSVRRRLIRLPLEDAKKRYRPCGMCQPPP